MFLYFSNIKMKNFNHKAKIKEFLSEQSYAHLLVSLIYSCFCNFYLAIILKLQKSSKNSIKNCQIRFTEIHQWFSSHLRYSHSVTLPGSFEGEWQRLFQCALVKKKDMPLLTIAFLSRSGTVLVFSSHLISVCFIYFPAIFLLWIYSLILLFIV